MRDVLGATGHPPTTANTASHTRSASLSQRTRPVVSVSAKKAGTGLNEKAGSRVATSNEEGMRTVTHELTRIFVSPVQKELHCRRRNVYHVLFSVRLVR
jgi:hypothetical protein